MSKLPVLSPSQQTTVDAIQAAAGSHSILNLWTRAGNGRTTMLLHLQEKLNAKLIGMSEYLEMQIGKHPYSFQETIYTLLQEHLSPDQPLILDDFHVLCAIGANCYADPRSGYINVVAHAISNFVREKQCQLILGSRGRIPKPLSVASYGYGVSALLPEDYAHLIGQSGLADSIDVDEVHRFAPRLNCYQLTEAARVCFDHGMKSTGEFIDYLRSKELASNVELAEVEDVKLSDLEGLDELIESLEANVVFPMENDALAQKYKLKAKRGVLLLGPPGTGKTTIGKALAHRLRGKFFLVDGTLISGTEHFYQHISQIFEQAKANAPSVIFVDDSDVIFESGQEHGLYRYLLTMLDGLEGESAGRVCVMLTAMDIRHIPPALIRSGRVELWLETNLPDNSARANLIQKLLGDLEDEVEFSVDEIAVASEGCTPADLKRLMNEAKIKLAWNIAQQREPKSLTEYALQSIEELKDLKERYSKTRSQTKSDSNRPVWFDVESP